MVTQLVVWLNGLANPVAEVVIAPIAWMPGWLSITLIGVVTGILMLVVFKYTSNQSAIKHTRNRLKADLLALSLFQDDLRVGLRAQGRLLAGAARLLGLSLVPMLIMALPMGLLLGQLGLWYQARPLRTGEESVVTVRLAADAPDSLRAIELVPSTAVEAVIGPVRVPSKNMVCWTIRPVEPGRHPLEFSTGRKVIHKELAVGENMQPTSLQRPAWNWTDVLVHPRERPFTHDSPIQSIEVAYPTRPSWTSGTNSWMI
ncbi:MAG: hypothetical protein AB7U20_17205, partial [Planctomycetaceae bacterium]